MSDEIIAYQLVFSDGRTSSVLYSKDEAERFKKASDITVDVRPLYATPPAPSVAVKALRWKGPDSYGEYHSLDGLWGYIIRCEDDGHWLTEVGEHFRSPEAAKAAAQSDYEARIRSTLSAQVQDVATARDALHAIANLPTGKNIDVCQGHEEAYRAVEALFSTPPKIQVHDVAKPDDELFWRLRIAYKRGAEWRDTTGSMHLVDKASYDYADKITSPLAAAPAKQGG